jgi:serine/threonine protein kinase
MALDELRLRKGTVLPEALDALRQRIATCTSALERSDVVLPYSTVKTTPMYFTLVPARPRHVTADSVDEWTSLEGLHGLPVKVALRITACVIRALLDIHATGDAHRFVEPAAISVRRDALTAAMQAENGSSKLPGDTDRTDEVDVLLGRYPLPVGIVAERARGAKRRFRAVAPEVLLQGGSDEVAAADSTLPAPSSRGLRRAAHVATASHWPSVGRAADTWGVAALLANLVGSEPLNTEDLLDANVASPWLGHYPPAVTSLLTQCLKADPEERPTLAIVSTHPAFSYRPHLGIATAAASTHNDPGAKVPALRPALTPSELIELLRRRKRTADSSPDVSPTKAPRSASAPTRQDENETSSGADEESGDENAEAESDSDEEVDEEEASDTDNGDDDDDETDGDSAPVRPPAPAAAGRGRAPVPPPKRR